MPTPFYHLSLAEDLLSHPTLAPPHRQFLRSQQPAFFFGNTAPDVQVVSGQARDDTHFFRVPIDRPDPAWRRMLEIHPELRHPGDLGSAQAAFLIGYLCHLQADQRWMADVFIPFFGPEAGWQSFSQRLYLHNVLRSYLDLQIISGLPAGIEQDLEAVRPENWLPFVSDRNLVAWRDFLARQLQPGAEIETVDVFAQRQGISREAYFQVIHSEEEMERQVFSVIPRAMVDQNRRETLADNLQLIAHYLDPQEIQMAASRRVEAR